MTVKNNKSLIHMQTSQRSRTDGTFSNQVETTLITKGLMYNYLPKVLPGLVFDTEIGQNTKEYTVMRFLDLKETSTDMAADWIFEKFKLI